MPFKIIPFIFLYAAAHLVTDAACAYLLLGILDLSSNAILAMLIYNAAAFVLQAPFGLLIDRMLNPKLAAMTGLTLIATSFLFWNHVYAALIIVSIGNALYHVGGGSLVLSLKDRKATFSGIYVAPGAIGLALGAFLSVSEISINLLAFPALLLFLCGLVYYVRTPAFNRTSGSVRMKNFDFGVFVVILIMIPIAVRSLIGLSINFPWKQNQHLLYVLLAALVLGKVFGGILADRYGLIRIGVGGLLISAPLLAFHSELPVLGILGAFTFNFTMPVTLIAILNVLPQNRGLSFGLTTVALFAGALPTILNNNLWLKNDMMVLSLIILAAIILFLALRFVTKPGTPKTSEYGL